MNILLAITFVYGVIFSISNIKFLGIYLKLPFAGLLFITNPKKKFLNGFLLILDVWFFYFSLIFQSWYWIFNK